MTERKAIQEKLSFTGVYERGYNRSKAKARAVEIRKQYKCRAVLVEASCGGVSVYADEKYFAAQTLERDLVNLGNIEARMEAAKATYEKTLQIIAADKLRFLQSIEKSKSTINA